MKNVLKIEHGVGRKTPLERCKFKITQFHAFLLGNA
jgi:hypothetical protein